MTGFARFNKRWASTGATLDPTDTQANAGFAFLGATPPSVELFNALLQDLDDKDNNLYGWISAVLSAASITPADATPGQLLAAMQSLVGHGRLLAVRSLSAGAYAPTAGTVSVEVEVIGGSGGGGGTPATGAGQSAAGGGGGSGARCRGFFTSGFSGAIVTIGAGGAAVSGAAGGNAGTSSFGALLSAPGGIGGGLTLNAAPPWASLGGAGGALAAGGYWNEAGAPGANGISIAAIGVVSGGGGGYGGGAPQFFNNPGVAGIGHGGGSGAAAGASQAAFAGGAGSAGQVIVREYS